MNIYMRRRNYMCNECHCKPVFFTIGDNSKEIIYKYNEGPLLHHH